MIIFVNAKHQLHEGRYEMFRGRLIPCHETPSRLRSITDELDRRGFGEIRTPGAIDLELLSRVHSRDYLDFLATAWDEWIAMDASNTDVDILPSVWPAHSLRRDVYPTNFSARVGRFAFDAGSPICAGTWEAVVQGAACALDSALAVSSGANAAMALTRPPGHHASADCYGGYCFLNNSALAAQSLREAGANRVAIVDIDYHHGNGTQSIFYGRADVLTVSIHGDPASEYPFYLGYADERGSGDGDGYNLNLPLPRGTDFRAWKVALAAALSNVKEHRCDALVVPTGVDTFEGDPISGFTLKSEDYLQIGAQIAEAGLPTVFVMEGGYALDNIGVNVVNVLEGFEAR